jgi:hypothetical protein
LCFCFKNFPYYSFFPHPQYMSCPFNCDSSIFICSGGTPRFLLIGWKLPEHNLLLILSLKSLNQSVICVVQIPRCQCAVCSWFMYQETTLCLHAFARQ